MSRRLLSTSRALPGLVRSMIIHCVHPRGAAVRTSSTATRLSWGLRALSSASAAMRTSAAISLSARAYCVLVAVLARAIQMPEKPPTPTPCRARKRCKPRSMFLSDMIIFISTRRFSTIGW